MIKDEKREIRKYLILSAYLLWLCSAVLGITLWNDFTLIKELRNYFMQLAYLMLIITFLFKSQYSQRDVIGIGVILFCCIVSAQSVYNNTIIPVIIFAYFMSEINFEWTLKSTFLLQAIMMIITIVACKTGILEDIIWQEGDRIRYSLGYDYCGYPAHILFFMTLIWFSLRKKARIFEGALFLFLNYGMYVITDSRTDFALSVVGVAGFFIWERSQKYKSLNIIKNHITKYSFMIAAIVSIIVHWIYNEQNSTMAKINMLLNGRLALGHDAITTYGFSLFGQKIRWIGQGSLKADPTRVYNYVDCSFLKEALSYGIVFFIVLGIGFYIASKKIILLKNNILGWAILMSLAYSVINAHLCVLTFNVFILILGGCFSNQMFEKMTVPLLENDERCINVE